MQFDFGVRTGDIETAKQWVQRLTGLIATEKYSTDLGGRFYSFSGHDGETVDLVQNLDLFDNSPMIDGLETWGVVLFVHDALIESKVAKALLHDESHFVLIKKT